MTAIRVILVKNLLLRPLNIIHLFWSPSRPLERMCLIYFGSNYLNENTLLMKFRVSKNFLADANPKITEVFKHFSYQNSEASV